MHEHLRTALTAATARGVTVAVLAEDPLDDPKFSGAPAKALSGLLVDRLRWPIDQRPVSGAALHAKVVVVDRRIALITSANILGALLATTSRQVCLSEEETSRNALWTMSTSCCSAKSCGRPNSTNMTATRQPLLDQSAIRAVDQ
jgi:hypothetical protein